MDDLVRRLNVQAEELNDKGIFATAELLFEAATAIQQAEAERDVALESAAGAQDVYGAMLDALAERDKAVEALREAMKRLAVIADGDVPRPVATVYRND